MKLKTRLAVAFMIITIVPMLLIFVSFFAINDHQARSFTKEYGLTEQVDLLNGNSTQVFNRLTRRVQQVIREELDKKPELYEDSSHLDEVNAELQKHYAYLVVRKGTDIIYFGDADEENKTQLCEQLPEFDILQGDLEGGIYLDGESQHLVKQMDFQFPDKTEGSVFIISNVDDLLPEVKSMIREMLFLGVMILLIAGITLTFWVYQSILSPLNKLQEATKKIRDGNLEFTLDVDADDEIGHLCQDFEEMRMRLKESAEEKVQYDKESKELISNISHDLKTPITAIKGYVEGIMDGVASSPEKLDKYIRTIYNKANEMNLLINELTLYSKIDTNRIPYNFTTISAKGYFADCAEDLSVELESKGAEFTYRNFMEEDSKVIVDPEQLRRVINNIVSNSIKYTDKPKVKITMDVKDVGDFIQVELGDNGKGIAAKDLPNIFDRFYRTDASRNSSKGGSGIGLSIVKKIVEEHGGKIWATSEEGVGTTMYFVIRKYQEVPVEDE